MSFCTCFARRVNKNSQKEKLAFCRGMSATVHGVVFAFSFRRCQLSHSRAEKIRLHHRARLKD
jgi:hypothetical protein